MNSSNLSFVALMLFLIAFETGPLGLIITFVVVIFILLFSKKKSKEPNEKINDNDIYDKRPNDNY